MVIESFKHCPLHSFRVIFTPMLEKLFEQLDNILRAYGYNS